jgi:hypothetical protein
MKTVRITALALGFCLALSARADATDFKLGSYSVTLNSGGSGLQLWTSNLLEEADKTFSLNSVGQSYETELFRIGTSEVSLDGDDLMPNPISVALSFVAPPPGFAGAAGGLTGAAWFIVNFGYVVWDNPAILAFGDGGLLGVSLTSTAFGLPGYSDIRATFTLLQADSRTVPEPGTLALLGLGAALGLSRSRRFRQSS